MKISATSLAGIRAKKALEATIKPNNRTDEEFPREPFNDTDFLLQWNKFAQKLEDRGQKILHTLLLMSDPIVEGVKIIHELPNNSTKEEMEKIIPELLGYLRGKLHNHDIHLQIVVNEKVSEKRAFTPLEKYNRLKGINPHLETLKQEFDLDF